MSRATRLLAALVVALAMAAACSRTSDRSPSAGLTPTAPSARQVGPVSTVNTIRPSTVANIRPLAIDFPPRNEAFDFRNQLETKYRDGLKRPASSTFVDLEGDVVWTQEYMRLRVNGCDHIAAVQKVFGEIDAGGVATCGSASTAAGVAEVISFPPRDEPFDFRRQLELKYQTMGRRSTSTFVDIEGIIVWLQEYLRYRVSSCDHASSVQKVFTQIDGGGVQPDCTPPPPPPPPPASCLYTVSPSIQTFTSAGGSFTATVTRTSGSCSWTATSDASFITLTGATAGADPGSFGVTVAANTGAARTGTVTIAFSGGSTQLVVSQSAAPPSTIFAAFRMFDPARQAAATTECQIRSLTSTPTTCVLDASQSFALGKEVIVSYAWVVQYTYVTGKSLTATSTSPRFTFSDLCGQTGSTDDGAIQSLSVQLTVTDSAGSTVTVQSGAGSQPALTLRLFTCGV
jgi:hypothetical protein